MNHDMQAGFWRIFGWAIKSYALRLTLTCTLFWIVGVCLSAFATFYAYENGWKNTPRIYLAGLVRPIYLAPVLALAISWVLTGQSIVKSSQRNFALYLLICLLFLVTSNLFGAWNSISLRETIIGLVLRTHILHLSNELWVIVRHAHQIVRALVDAACIVAAGLVVALHQRQQIQPKKLAIGLVLVWSGLVLSVAVSLYSWALMEPLATSMISEWDRSPVGRAIRQVIVKVLFAPHSIVSVVLVYLLAATAVAWACRPTASDIGPESS